MKRSYILKWASTKEFICFANPLTWIASNIWQSEGVHRGLDAVDELPVVLMTSRWRVWRFYRRRGTCSASNIEVLLNLTAGLMHQNFIVCDTRETSFHFATYKKHML